MDYVCSTRGSGKKCIRHFLSEDMKEGGHLESLEEDGTVIIKEILRIRFYEC